MFEDGINNSAFSSTLKKLLLGADAKLNPMELLMGEEKMKRENLVNNAQKEQSKAQLSAKRKKKQFYRRQ